MTDMSDTPVFDAIASRKSVRGFEDSSVEDEKLKICLEAARLAPSWANKQCWHFVVVQGKQAVDDLGLVPAHIKNTPVLIVACGDPDKSGSIDGKQYYMVDVAIAVEHLVLAAWEQGLGTPRDRLGGGRSRRTRSGRPWASRRTSRSLPSSRWGTQRTRRASEAN